MQKYFIRTTRTFHFGNYGSESRIVPGVPDPLAQGADPKAHTRPGNTTALHCAAQAGRTEVVKTLLEAGAAGEAGWVGLLPISWHAGAARCK